MSEQVIETGKLAKQAIAKDILERLDHQVGRGKAERTKAKRDVMGLELMVGASIALKAVNANLDLTTDALMVSIRGTDWLEELARAE
jgi:hypothetical protein